MAKAVDDELAVREMRALMAKLGTKLCNDALERKVTNLKETHEAIVNIYNAIKANP